MTVPSRLTEDIATVVPSSSFGSLNIDRERDALLELGPSNAQALRQRRRASEGAQVDKRNTMILVNVASVLERTDEQLLPSVYKYVACSFQAQPDQLGYITSARALCQALSSALGGYLGHRYDRSVVIAAGCFIWGGMTLLFSLVNSWQWGAFFWAWNGVGLAFVIPNTQSIVADMYTVHNRGKAFGVLYTTGALGGMLGATYATNMAGYNPMGIVGWRFAFRTVAAVAILIGLAALRFAKDPNHSGWGSGGGSHASQTFSETVSDMKKVAQIRTFQVIILQGILGSTPWNALVYLTLYLQLIGFSNFHASMVLTFFLGGAALGGVLGGAIGDWAARISPDHGRIWACQFSVSMGIPFTLIILKLLPRNGDSITVGMYAVSMFLFGLFHVWAAPACNNPVFAEIVPPHLRNLVYAFDRSFEGAIAALGTPLVGIIAERCFNFPVDSPAYDCKDGVPVEGTSNIASLADKADALGNAMTVCMLVPWTACLIIYSGLHWTYPRDRKVSHFESEGPLSLAQ